MTDAPAAATAPEAAKPPAEWKPEPRTWTWRDLFSAPMLAFKPKCMLVSALTLLLLGAWTHLFYSQASEMGSWREAVAAAFVLVGLVVFGIGATLVAVFMKADLLDDEFLSFGEALGQYKGRILAAVLVPVFLLVLAAGVHGLLVWFPMFIASIPYAGGLLYGLLYPLGFFAAVFAILLTVAVALSLFVFPAIVAIRRHGWFDNVVDTIEAVGTKPHVLIGSLILICLLSVVALLVANWAGGYLRTVAANQPAWGAASDLSDPSRVEDRAQEISVRGLSWMANPLKVVANGFNLDARMDNTYGVEPIERSRYAFSGVRQETHAFYRWCSGLIGGFWQTVVGALVLGYCLNLFIGGGMLTYLVVREDDYWDDEDLEDLDKLAKELEDEAKREESGQAPAPAAPAPAAPAEAKPAPADGTLPTQVIPPKE